MEQKLEKKYGLMTAIAMVIGIVVGSGVFFKAEYVLNATGGNLPVGILAWIIGGLVMVICASMFSILAVQHDSVGGLLGYAEAVAGKRYGYYIGWFMATVYTPAITSVLAWVSARYTCVLIGWPITGGQCMTLAGLYLILVYAMNELAPIVAGRFQISTTVIKLIPLIAMAVVGSIAGLISGTTVENFTTAVSQDVSGNPLFSAVVATVFAYEGWIVATSINTELRNAKRNMPIALVAGTLIIMLVYILYYIGLAGAVPNEVMMQNGEQGAFIAFTTLFGKFGSILFVFVIISCLGTLNGLMMGCVRNLYALSSRGWGPKPKIFAQVDPETNMPQSSGIFALAMSSLWLAFFYGANLDESWFGPFAFDSSELPIVALYALYIPIFVLFMKKEKNLSMFKRIVVPTLAIGSCLLVMVAAWFAHGTDVFWFLLVMAVCFALAAWYERKNKILDTEPISAPKEET